MKLLFGLLAVGALGALVYVLVTSDRGRPESQQADPVAAPIVEPAPQTADLVTPQMPPLPAEVEEELGDLEEEEPFQFEEVDTPRVLSREKLPDGRVQVKILSPVYYGDGTKKTLIRVLTGTPRYMKRERVMQRSAPQVGPSSDEEGSTGTDEEP
jgi:hypothetical protein